MLISARQAADILRWGGFNVDRSRLLLRSGVAGGVPTSSGTMYDEDRVRELAVRRFVRPAEIATACPGGILVGRLARTKSLDLTADAATQLAAVHGPWRVPLLWGILLDHCAKSGTPMPFVATVCGYVLVGAEVTGFERGTGDRATLHLREAGPWFASLRERRWLAGRGGPALLLWGWPPDISQRGA